ncbi:MAG: GH25 family lysozyme [Oscillospiraceae bacterium]
MSIKMIKSLLVILIILSISILILLFKGVIQLNNPERLGYTVKGVDVSEYQGEIDWSELSSQGIQFAFIKATEGSSYVDKYFHQNFENAKKTDLRIGAYHFFSFESAGSTQADNFISNVDFNSNSLPNVIDLELYGEFRDNPLDKDTVQRELSIMLDKLREHYYSEPIIYTTVSTYNLYLKDFDQYHIWFRDVYSSSNLDVIPNVDFWQYSNRKVLKGYSGEEKFIDMNVFIGSQEDFNNYY